MLSPMILAPTYCLTERESQTLWMYGYLGMSSKQVANELGVSLHTMQSYMKRIREKLRERGTPADSKADLFRAALLECGIIPECREARRSMLMMLSKLARS